MDSKQFEASGSPKSILRTPSSPSNQTKDVETNLLLSTSVPIKIGNDSVIKKDLRNRIRYTFGLRTVKSTLADSINEPSEEHNIKNSTKQSQSEIQDQLHEPKSKLVDNLSKNNKKIVKQTTIDYYV